MKQLYLLFILVFAFLGTSAQETYRFRTDAPQGLTIENSTATGLSLHYSVSEITVTEALYGDAKGHEILMKGCFGSFAEGLPNLPFENRYIAVPQGATVSVNIREKGCQTLQDIALLPAAPLQMNCEDKRPALHWDAKVFTKDADFPSENVSIAQTTQIRGLDVVMLSVTPFRYNPVKKTLEVIYDMDIEVRFEGGNGHFGDVRYRNPAWDGILRDLVINGDMLPEAHYYERLNAAVRDGEEGCEYLIISPDDPAILAWADTLKQFRMRQGILTKVVTTTDCGSNEPEDIRNFILNAYENWAIPPAAVLLFAENHAGAPEFGLKPYIFTSPVSWGHIYSYPSDNPFADMNGDSIPDLAISRIVTKYPDEYQQQVEKLINYELNPPTDPHYYDHPVITSGYEEDKWFTITSQCVNNFFCNTLEKHPTNLYMKYYSVDHDPTPPDSIWSTGPNTNAVLDYFGPNGTNYIPSTLAGLNDWIDMENDWKALPDALNEECFLTFYRDHSSQYYWCCPYFFNSDLPSLTNQKPTFVFSIGCLTNNFWDNWYTCLSEAFLKADPGAIGVLGANTVTYSHFNDLITWGMLDYFWSDFMPTLGSQSQPEFSYPSYSLVAGKLFLRQQAFLPYSQDTIIEKIEKTLNIFSFLGETYLNLYTEVPQQIAIEASPYHSNNQWEYTFTAEEGATVCLSKDGEIIQVLCATGQPQSLTLPEMEIGEQFTVTATKPNHIRHEQIVTVVSESHAFVYLKDYVLNDQDGNGQLDYGEYADIDITVHNAVPVASEGSRATLHCDSPYIEIVQGTASYPALGLDSVLTIKKAFRIKLANDVPDQTVIAFRVHFSEGENIHDDRFNITANAPLIQIEPEYWLATAEEEPSTHISTEGKSYLTFAINNIGHSTAMYPNASLTVKAPFVSVESEQQLERLEPNGHGNLTFELTTHPNAVTGAWLQSQLDVQYRESHAYSDTIVQYGGIFENFETDTLHPAFTWGITGSNHWVFSDEDVYEGNRCLVSQSDSNSVSRLMVRWDIPHVNHNSKISFRYKTDSNGTLVYSYSLSSGIPLVSDEWQYAEMLYDGSPGVIWRYYLSDNESAQARLDDLCFPPAHTTIAYAGNDIVTCSQTPIILSKAYAYDCNSMLWTTQGDGHFDSNAIANPTYSPGSQDLANGSVLLTLTAFGNDTIVSSTQIRFMDDIELGAIVGDDIVNKYENQVSQYSIVNQEGLSFVWQLEPTEAGIIYDHGNAIDIVWNQHEGDAEVVLSVKADNGCDMEPATKTISLIGYGISEWPSVNFDLYPNPTDGKVNLVVGETLQGKAVVEVYNLLGERMMVKDFHHLQRGEMLCLDLSSFVSGLYIIKLSTEKGNCTKKVSVK